jgi:hypothetical protein
MQRQTKIIADTAAVHKLARRARLQCTDIIRQTSLKPYYGKYGGAALYAPEDVSEKQLQRITEARECLTRAACLLREAAIAGGITDALVAEAMRGDVRTKGQVIGEDGKPLPRVRLHYYPPKQQKQ